MATTKNRTAKAELQTAAPVVLSEDERLALGTGGLIREWLAGMAPFFTRATALELSAKSTLAAARAWTLPKDSAEDEALQRAIKQTTADRKEIEEHWAICSQLSKLHRWTTARRAVGADALEQANTIGNRLHAQFVDEQRRKAEAESRRLREEAEFLARQEREQELARMEADAVAAEERSPDLSERERLFVEYFATPGIGSSGGGNAQAAAKLAGFKDPLVAGARLLSKDKIQMAIKLRTQATTIRRQAAAKAEAPIAVQTETVRPDITKAAGASDRTSWTGECFDERRLMTAFLGCAPEDFKNNFGIPADLFMVNPVKANEYARALHENLDRWPGMRHHKKTSVV